MSDHTKSHKIQHAWLAVLTIALSLFAPAVRAEPELLGARKLIEKAKGSYGEKRSQPEEVSPAEAKREAFAKEVEAFRQTYADLAPETAAEQWLALVDGFAALPKDQSMGYGYHFANDPFGGMASPLKASSVSLPAIVSLLPGPAAWDALDNAVAKRKGSTAEARKRNAALRILMDLLQGRLDGVGENLTALKASLGEGADNVLRSYHGGSADQRLVPLRDAIRKTVGFTSKEEVVKNYRELLAKPVEKSERNRQLMVPDLCRLTSEKEARELLRQTVLLEGLTPMVSVGGKTLQLLKEVLLEEMENTTQPMWNLVTSPEDTELYEALDRKYPVKQQDETATEGSLFMRGQSYRSDPFASARKSAEVAYLVGLIAEGRLDDAVALAKRQQGSRGLSYYQLNRMTLGMPQEKLAANMFAFLEKLLSDNPESRWWESYPAAALMAKQGDATLTHLSKALADSELKLPMRIILLEQKCKLDLSLGNIDAGIAGLREISASDVSGQGRQEQQVSHRIYAAAQRLTQIGILLKRPELVDEGIERTVAWTEKSSQNDNYGQGGWYQSAGLVQLLIEAERFAEAEQQILEGIVDALQAKAVSMASTGGSSMHASSMLIDMSQQLTLLVQVYTKLGRTEDVWYLLQEVPWWNTPTLPTRDEALITAAAKALVVADRKDDAIKLLKRFILSGAPADRAYEVLLGLEPVDLIEWLEQLYVRDRFEERPLIWKAVALKNDGKLDEAEAAVRQALKVDPTDGETEAGQRVIAYGILADIIEAKGNKDDAAFFRGVVRAVRTAEEGDKFSEAGLLSKSLELYEQAENDFVDAYCVQWRLAERLHALGRYEEAEKHYEIAFERMPEQFGRVASFCFGCSGVFAKEHSRSVAERILTRLLKTHPDKPQVYFLMGQLREAQDEDSQAYDYYRKAVELDPQYLDAWEKLYALSKTLFLPKVETDAMAIKALKLDPMQRHFGSGLDVMTDMKAMWAVMMENQELAVGDIDVEIELRATQEAVDDMMAKMGPAARKMARLQRGYSQSRYGQINPQRPGAVLANHQIVQQLFNILAR